MRTLALHDILARNGASFIERFGVEVATGAAPLEQQYHWIRDCAGVTDFSHIQMYRVPEESGIDFLDGLLAGNVAKVRYGRVLHTFLGDENGRLVADCYVANNDEEFVITCESLAGDQAIDALFLSEEGVAAGVEKLTGTHVALGLDGYKSWAVMKEMFGADVLGLPYLSIENYTYENAKIHLIRAGKTSEFGYLLIAPVDSAATLFGALLAGAQKNGGGLCGVDIHDELRLEGRFFNIYAEGYRVGDPLELGLQWMIDFDKDSFRGADALRARRSAGIKQKIVGVALETGETRLHVGDSIYDGGEKVAEVVAACYSGVLKCAVGLAMFPVGIAYSGLTFSVAKSGGPAVKTVSMPPIMPRSLSVKLDEL